jgi:hypothetical protein
MAFTGSAIFEAIFTGRTRLKYYDWAHYHNVLRQVDEKRRVAMQPFRLCLSTCVNELRTRYGTFDITAAF